MPPIEVVAGIIKKTKKGVDIATLRRKSGFDEKKIYILVYRLMNGGSLELKKLNLEEAKGDFQRYKDLYKDGGDVDDKLKITESWLPWAMMGV